MQNRRPGMTAVLLFPENLENLLRIVCYADHALNGTGIKAIAKECGRNSCRLMCSVCIQLYLLGRQCHRASVVIL